MRWLAELPGIPTRGFCIASGSASKPEDLELTVNKDLRMARPGGRAEGAAYFTVTACVAQPLCGIYLQGMGLFSGSCKKNRLRPAADRRAVSDPLTDWAWIGADRQLDSTTASGDEPRGGTQPTPAIGTQRAGSFVSRSFYTWRQLNVGKQGGVVGC